MDVPDGRGAQQETCVAPLRSIKRCLSSLFRLKKKNEISDAFADYRDRHLKEFLAQSRDRKKTFACRYAVFVSEFIFLDT